MKQFKIYYHPTVITFIPTIKLIWGKSHKYKCIEITFLFWDFDFQINK